MGQQQLILLTVAVVIVGLATVVGIEAFQDNKAKANLDQLSQDLARIASDAQAWKQKPSPFGGQSATDCPPATCADANFTGLTLAKLGYQTTDAANLVYQNLNGQYTAAPTTTNLTLEGYNNELRHCVVLTVDGLTPENLQHAVHTDVDACP